MIFFLVLVAMITMGRIVRTAIHAHYGYPLDRRGRPRRGERGEMTGEITRQNLALAEQNEHLRGKVARLEDRMAVLERIATDAPARLGAEIEKLRD
jgi:hypothetical protein